jgi:endonuclease/exonuclease/phosphatase family metal-dependent hydrolase
VESTKKQRAKDRNMKSAKWFILVLFFVTHSAAISQDYHVISYNIRYNNPSDGLDAWPLRKADMARFLFEKNYDVIGLQEVLKDQIDFLEDRARDYAYYGVGREDGKEKGEYCPIFYNKKKFELLSANTYWLSPHSDQPGKGWDAACERIVTVVHLKDKKTTKDFVVMNTHWDHEGKMARSNSARLIADWVKEEHKKGNVVLLLGDFNLNPTDGALNPLRFVMTDTCPADQLSFPTFNAFQMKVSSEQHIDYIWCSKNDWFFSKYEILNPSTTAGRQLSDHFPVTISVRLFP